jgi:hypothetical protein
MDIHCKHCKSKTANSDEVLAESAGKFFLKAVCAVCGMKKARRVKKPGDKDVATEDTADAQQ